MSRKTEDAAMCFVEENGGAVLYVEVDGKRIAKRYPGGNWIALEPGYTVHGSEPGGARGSITVEFDSRASERRH
jgi:hypothetical protein